MFGHRKQSGGGLSHDRLAPIKQHDVNRVANDSAHGQNFSLPSAASLNFVTLALRR